jgi:hypothetical protein
VRLIDFHKNSKESVPTDVYLTLFKNPCSPESLCAKRYEGKSKSGNISPAIKALEKRNYIKEILPGIIPIYAYNTKTKKWISDRPLRMLTRVRRGRPYKYYETTLIPLYDYFVTINKNLKGDQATMMLVLNLCLSYKWRRTIIKKQRVESIASLGEAIIDELVKLLIAHHPLLTGKLTSKEPITEEIEFGRAIALTVELQSKQYEDIMNFYKQPGKTQAIQQKATEAYVEATVAQQSHILLHAVKQLSPRTGKILTAFTKMILEQLPKTTPTKHRQRYQEMLDILTA